jgi:hypothetical protein
MTQTSRNEVGGVFASRAAKVRSKVYTRHVWQLCDGNPAQWQTQYTLTTSPGATNLTVSVAINAVNGSAQATANVIGGWGMRIGTVWNNKAQISVPVYANATATAPSDVIRRKVVFELVTAPSGYQVTCNHTRTAQEYLTYFDGLSATDRNNLISNWMVSSPEVQGYQTTLPEWKKLQKLADVPRDHTRHGTPDLGAWGDQDTEALQHEFGHGIGLPDEYVTTRYFVSPDGATWTEITLDPTIYNRPPFTTRSLMNNTMSRSGSQVFPRHFYLLRNDFADFVATTLGITGVVKPNTATVQMVT